jgi:hypothetical protein
MQLLRHDRRDEYRRVSFQNFHDSITANFTGSLIAVMLGRLKMDIDRCINVYIGMMDSVFRKGHHRIGPKGNFQARFNTDELERSIKKVIVDRGLLIDTTMRHKGPPDDSECKV